MPRPAGFIDLNGFRALAPTHLCRAEPVMLTPVDRRSGRRHEQHSNVLLGDKASAFRPTNGKRCSFERRC